MLRIVCALLFLVPLTSCCYHFDRQTERVVRYPTIQVPYAIGDHEGLFTDTLIRTLSTNSPFIYSSSGAALCLKVILLGIQDKNIGFVYAPAIDADNDYNKIVVANEARACLKAEVSVVDRQSGCLVFGPTIVSAFLDYDFEPDLSNINEQRFALGQLEMHDAAQDAALVSLYRCLAEKIVELINYGGVG